MGIRNVLFTFQIFRHFPEIFLFLRCNKIELWTESIFLNALKKLLGLRNMTGSGKRSVCTWKDDYLAVVAWSVV